MIKFLSVLLLCPLLLQGCGTSPASDTRSRATQKSSKDSDVKAPSGKPTDHSGNTPGKGLGDDDEVAVPPQAVTGAALTCGKPHVLDAALNIDCFVKNASGERVTLSELGPRVAYGVDSTEKDDDVLISTHEAEPGQKYDVRYAVRATDLSKIDRIVDASTFFVKVYDEEGEEIEGAVESFLGIDLDMPSVAEMKKAFLGGIADLGDLFGP